MRVLIPVASWKISKLQADGLEMQKELVERRNQLKQVSVLDSEPPHSATPKGHLQCHERNLRLKSTLASATPHVLTTKERKGKFEQAKHIVLTKVRKPMCNGKTGQCR